MRYYHTLLTLGLFVLATQFSTGAVLPHVDVFTSGTEGYHTFRIPCVARTADGALHAFAEGRLTNRSDPGGTPHRPRLQTKH